MWNYHSNRGRCLSIPLSSIVYREKRAFHVCSTFKNASAKSSHCTSETAAYLRGPSGFPGMAPAYFNLCNGCRYNEE